MRIQEMQTFLPEPDIILSMERLDWRRLNKQRSEALQLIRALEGTTEGWKNHPAAKMWTGYVPALKYYFDMACVEWQCRGYSMNMTLFEVPDEEVILPPWFGTMEFHRSHQSNLIRKLPSHYKKFWPGVPDDLPYIWPDPKGDANGPQTRT